MVTPAMQLASKIPDVHVQLWASAILKVNCRDAYTCIIMFLSTGPVPHAGGPYTGAGGACHAHQLQSDTPEGPLRSNPAARTSVDKLDGREFSSAELTSGILSIIFCRKEQYLNIFSVTMYDWILLIYSYKLENAVRIILRWVAGLWSEKEPDVE